VPVLYVPNHEVVGSWVVGLGTSLPKMWWVVYDPPNTGKTIDLPA